MFSDIDRNVAALEAFSPPWVAGTTTQSDAHRNRRTISASRIALNVSPN
jgi:hypothetical protein